MHTNELQRRAIAAVARLSLFAGIAGCGGTVIVDSDDVIADTDTDTDPGDTTTTETTTAETTTTLPEPESTCFDAPSDPTTCCNALLLTTFADDHLFADPSLATDEEQACCQLAVTTADTWAGPDALPFDWSNISGCCGTVVTGGFEEHPSCTPWGPPMPPRMPPRMPRRFAAQAVLA